MSPNTLQLSEDLGEEAWLSIYPQHRPTQLVDNVNTTVPELFFVCFNQERLQWVADLIAHVAVGQIEAGEHDGLQLCLLHHAAVNTVADQQVHEHYISWVDEGNVLPSLEQKRPVHGPQPHYAVARLEITQFVAAVVEKIPKTLQQLRCACLNNCFLWCWFDQRLSFDVIIIIVDQFFQWILIIIFFLSDVKVCLVVGQLKIFVAEVAVTLLLSGLDISSCVRRVGR